MGDEFALEITKRAIARACGALDFKFASPSALNVLADVVRHYIQSVGENCRDHAELAGRSAPGLFDVVSALDQLVSAKKYFSLEIYMQ